MPSRLQLLSLGRWWALWVILGSGHSRMMLPLGTCGGVAAVTTAEDHWTSLHRYARPRDQIDFAAAPPSEA
ncbi:hypothetical protein EDB81DRAFT_777581 [Dactylonectria macrodidyma]|uniref:Secreted protein n=1 Tax=Dactylonectria macrodidyma TaxID=307937 RepID=A0A9P9JLM9_9HYPO|nr:hypothetical protein EDB81DRAFT_777581 [Dactylonectria macrodidyma]